MGSRHCATQTLCNLDVEHYEICLIKALLCYDEYCEPDLSALPFDYRLYDLCCHINEIEKDVHRFENWILLVLGIIILVIFVCLYEISNILQKYSIKKLFCDSYKKIKYFTKWMNKNYVSMKIIKANYEYFYNELCKKTKRMKRSIKYHYKNNKMIQFIFDEYLSYFSFSSFAVNHSTKDLKQKHDEVNNISTNCLINTEETKAMYKEQNEHKKTKRNKTYSSNKKKKRRKKSKSKIKSAKSKQNNRKKKHTVKQQALTTEQQTSTDHIIICEYSESEVTSEQNEKYPDDEEKSVWKLRLLTMSHCQLQPLNVSFAVISMLSIYQIAISVRIHCMIVWILCHSKYKKVIKRKNDKIKN